MGWGERNCIDNLICNNLFYFLLEDGGRGMAGMKDREGMEEGKGEKEKRRKAFFKKEERDKGRWNGCLR